MEYQPIRQWSEEDRPREKLLLKGKNALSDAELVAILLAPAHAAKAPWTWPEKSYSPPTTNSMS